MSSFWGQIHQVPLSWRKFVGPACRFVSGTRHDARRRRHMSAVDVGSCVPAFTGVLGLCPMKSANVSHPARCSGGGASKISRGDHTYVPSEWRERVRMGVARPAAGVAAQEHLWNPPLWYLLRKTMCLSRLEINCAPHYWGDRPPNFNTGGPAEPATVCTVYKRGNISSVLARRRSNRFFRHCSWNCSFSDSLQSTFCLRKIDIHDCWEFA